MFLFRTLLLSVLAVSSACSLWAGTTQVLQHDPSITYTGVWYPNYESGNIGGSATLINDKGAINWIGVPDRYSGIAQVYLDGTPNTVDTYAPNIRYRQPLFAARGLASGTHRLSIQVLHQRDGNTDGSWIWINALNIENGTSVTGGVSATALVQQNDPSLIFSGNWYLNSNPVMSGGSTVLATDPASNASLTFTGSGVLWIAYRDQWSGVANVYVDGTLNHAIDTYPNPRQAQAVVSAISGLVPSLHTLTIEVTGTRDAPSAGSRIWVDAFSVVS